MVRVPNLVVNKINFLLNYKYPDADKIVGIYNIPPAYGINLEVTKTDKDIELKKKYNQILEYKKELESKTSEEIDYIYDIAIAEQKATEEKEFLKELEQIRPNIEKWKRLDRWTKKEALALSVNVDPDYIWAVLSRTSDIAIDFAKKCSLTEDIMSRSVLINSRNWINTPKNYISWFKEKDLPFPEYIEKSVLGLDYISTQNKIKLLEEENNNLKSELKKAKDDIASLKKDENDNKINPKTKDTLYKIILSLAIKYKFNPANEKQPSTAKIKDAIEKAGFEMNDNTIRSSVTNAYQHFKDKDIDIKFN